VLYNDYPNYHAQMFSDTELGNAWWQVALFVAVFLLLTPLVHHRMNQREIRRGSQVFRLMQTGPMHPTFQSRLEILFWGAFTLWLILAAIAATKLGDQIIYYFFPYLGYKADPWGRGRVGEGFDAVWSLAGYVQVFVATVFGLFVVLARNSRMRWLAIAGCALLWPYYIFDRTRNIMLAVVVPAILAWVFVRLRSKWLVKAIVLAASFALISIWFSFVIANRSRTSIVAATLGEGTDIEEASADAHHRGLNMFEELCWINTFLEDGSYKPNWGQRYFAELVNPIPRSLWPGKPMIGIDYSAARGQNVSRGSSADASGVIATISTGMIGQGVVNFGRVLGPAFAALLMSLWAALLARLDLHGAETGHIALYALGMILTFNLGRDITLITLYTFFFGWVIVWWLRRHSVHVQPESKFARGCRRLDQRPW
jgi:hypothetical protein